MYLIWVFFTSVVGNLKPPNGIFLNPFPKLHWHTHEVIVIRWEASFLFLLYGSPFPFHQACRQAWWGAAIMYILSLWNVRVQHAHADKILFYGDISLRFLSTEVVDVAIEVVAVELLVLWVKNGFLFHPHFMPQNTIFQKCRKNFLGPLKPRFPCNVISKCCVTIAVMGYGPKQQDFKSIHTHLLGLFWVCLLFLCSLVSFLWLDQQCFWFTLVQFFSCCSFIMFFMSSYYY